MTATFLGYYYRGEPQIHSRKRHQWLWTLNFYSCFYWRSNTSPIKTECPENVRKMFRIIIYKFRTLFIVRKMFQNVIVSDIQNLSGMCSEIVQKLSRICPSPEFVLKTDLWSFSGILSGQWKCLLEFVWLIFHFHYIIVFNLN